MRRTMGTIMVALLCGACGDAFEAQLFADGGEAGTAGAPADSGAADAPPDEYSSGDAGDSPSDATTCEPETAARHCGECQPGYYLSRLYDDMTGCLYLLRDCSLPCGTYLWCSWIRAAECLPGWKSAGRLSTPECGTGSDAIDGNNTTICEPIE